MPTDNSLTVEIPAEETTAHAPETTTEDTATPRRYAGEFDTVEELEARYQELLKTSSAAKAAKEETTQREASPEETPPAGEKSDAPTPPDRAAAEETLSGKGLDMAAFEREFTADGQLSDASYKKLEQAGIPRAMVDSYIAGQTALTETFKADIMALAGGEEGYAEMVAWARKNLGEQDIAAFDSVVCSGDKSMISLAVSGMAARWRDAEGADPARLVRGGTRGPVNLDVFESPAQVVEAMRDKRYGKDPAYTRQVEDKMARSKVFGG